MSAKGYISYGHSVKRISKETGMSKQMVEYIIRNFMGYTIKYLKAGSSVKIYRFGTITLNRKGKELQKMTSTAHDSSQLRINRAKDRRKSLRKKGLR
tara:strand:- start:3496 stop:3786 length:291 start_codon:yes stop_codon:yes gene_type:complete